MEKTQRIFKPLFEEAMARGLLKHRVGKRDNESKLEMMIDALDARAMSWGGLAAEDLAEILLQAMNINPENPKAVEAYVIGFYSGQKTTDLGADVMELSARNLSELSVVGESEEAEGEDE